MFINYLIYFRLYKYKNYINNYLYKYPLILNLINLQLERKNFFNFSNISILNNFQIYHQLKYFKNNLSNINYSYIFKIFQLIIKKNKLIKKLLLYNNNYLINLFFFIIKNSNIIIYIKILKLINYINTNIINLKNLHILNIKNLKNFENNFKNNLVNINYNKNEIFSYKFISKSNLNITNLKIWNNLIELLILEYIDLLFFKFFNEINFYKINFRYKKMWIQCWIILKRSKIFNFNKTKIKDSSYYYDIIIWRIFFINKWNIYFNCKFSLIILQINIQKEIYYNNNFVKNIIIYLFYIINYYYNKFKNIYLLLNYNKYIFLNLNNNKKILKNHYYINKIKLYIKYKYIYKYFFIYKNYIKIIYNIILLCCFFCSFLTKINKLV